MFYISSKRLIFSKTGMVFFIIGMCNFLKDDSFILDALVNGVPRKILLRWRWISLLLLSISSLLSVIFAVIVSIVNVTGFWRVLALILTLVIIPFDVAGVADSWITARPFGIGGFVTGMRALPILFHFFYAILIAFPSLPVSIYLLGSRTPAKSDSKSEDLEPGNSEEQ